MLHTTRPRRRDPGFTVIEVLIVLAIAGMILLIVFLVVPALQRSARNYDRKHTVDLIAGTLEEFRVNHGEFPQDSAEGDVYKNENPELPSKYYLRFVDKLGGHSYIPDEDEIVVIYEHWCNRYGNGYKPTDPVAGDDDVPSLYVVYTTLEPQNTAHPNIYCVDNYDHHPYVPPPPHP